MKNSALQRWRSINPTQYLFFMRSYCNICNMFCPFWLDFFEKLKKKLVAKARFNRHSWRLFPLLFTGLHPGLCFFTSFCSVKRWFLLFNSQSQTTLFCSCYLFYQMCSSVKYLFLEPSLRLSLERLPCIDLRDLLILSKLDLNWHWISGNHAFCMSFLYWDYFGTL